MVCSIVALLDFCYLVRRGLHTPATVLQIKKRLDDFHKYREVFRETRTRPSKDADEFSLPRQHSLTHYADRIWDFGAPNGLCSSITESKHIKAVKEPWRRSSRFEALYQMLTTNQRLDQLAAARVDFAARGMLEGSCLTAASSNLGEFTADNHILGKSEVNGLTSQVVCRSPSTTYLEGDSADVTESPY